VMLVRRLTMNESPPGRMLHPAGMRPTGLIPGLRGSGLVSSGLLEGAAHVFEAPEGS